ncbi:hypothetical protein SUGI_0433750 [Cryptomeria japonica]|nr:hypothetical protein SUGI_0433750 [Cryptomeria japonica]
MAKSFALLLAKAAGRFRTWITIGHVDPHPTGGVWVFLRQRPRLQPHAGGDCVIKPAIIYILLGCLPLGGLEFESRGWLGYGLSESRSGSVLKWDRMMTDVLNPEIWN